MDSLYAINTFIYKIERTFCSYFISKNASILPTTYILPVTDSRDLSKCKDFDLDTSVFIKRHNLRKKSVVPFDDYDHSSFEVESNVFCDIV